MIGNRMSGLPTAQFCGRAAGLSVGAGRAAAKSTAFHALCSGGLDKDVKLAQLTDEERKEIAEWYTPADIPLPGGGPMLRYSEAATEMEVALTDTARHCRADDPEAMTVGHLDMAWLIEWQGLKIAYVADIKKTQFTTLDGPASLQLLSYAFAFGALHGADAYCCGIWEATEGRWHWGDLVRFDSEEAAQTWDTIVFAAQNVGGDFALGPHCSSCWERSHCPAYLLPLELAETSLAPLTDSALKTNQSMLGLLQLKERAKATIEVVDRELKEWAKTHGGIDGGNGKRWLPVITVGRESFDSKAALAENPELSRYMKRGASYDTYRWVKA